MLRIGLTALFVIAGSVAARAALPESVSQPDWLRGEQIEYHVQLDGSYTLTQSFDITVNTEAALRAAAEQSFGWSAGLEDVRVVEAYTRKPDGQKLDVGVASVLNQSVGAGADYPSFSDWQARSIVFPGVHPGDTLHYVLQRHTVGLLFAGQFTASLHVGPAAHTRRADISIVLPRDMKLNVIAPGMQEAAIQTLPDGMVARHWQLAAPTPAADMTRPKAASGIVSFAASTFPDYAALGAAYAARAVPSAEPDAAIRNLSIQLTQGVNGRRAQAAALYDYVSGKIRYVGLQLGSGRVVPRSADAVLQSGYGDCKDHVALLQALLTAAGIKSIPALISTKPRYDLPLPPTLDVLDHVILFIPEFTVYADPTSGYAPFGVLPIGEYGKKVVWAGIDGAQVAQMPDLPPGFAATSVHTVLDVAWDGSVSGTTETVAMGPYAVALREIASGLGNAADQLRRMDTPGNGQYSFASPADLQDGSYKVAARFDLEDSLADAPDGRLVPPPGATVMVRPGGFLVSEAPVFGMHLCYTGQQSEEIRINLPGNRVAAELPPDVAVAAGFASYRATWRRLAHGAVVQRMFTVQSPRAVCNAAEYAALQPALRAARLDLRNRLQLRGITPSAPTAMAEAAIKAAIQPKLRAVSMQRRLVLPQHRQMRF